MVSLKITSPYNIYKELLKTRSLECLRSVFIFYIFEVFEVFEASYGLSDLRNSVKVINFLNYSEIYLIFYNRVTLA